MNQDADSVGQLRRLLEKHVPDIASGVVQIRGIAGKAGVRSIVVVYAPDKAVDPVGSVVGSRGSRIKPLVAELDNEKVDVARWSDSTHAFSEMARSENPPCSSRSFLGKVVTIAATDHTFRIAEC